VIVSFVNIGGIVDRHCLNYLFLALIHIFFCSVIM